MIPFSTLAACVVTLFVSLILPLGLLAVFALKCRKQGILPAWLLGAAGFVLTQLCIRLPVLTVLSRQSWFAAFSQEHLFAYAFSLAFTAGLFELAGRFAVGKAMQKKLTFRRALAAGLGHGGIEAIFITGMAYVNNLVYIAAINSGSFDALLATLPPEQVPAMEAVRTALLTTGPGLFLLAGLERLLAMTAHAAMSVLVCWGIHSGRTGKMLLACLAIHTFIDLTAGISLTTLPQTVQYVIIYAILIAAAAVSLWILGRIRSLWRKEEHHDFQV